MTGTSVELDVARAWAVAVSRHGDRRALVTPEGSWTYAELDRWSAQVGVAMRERGVARESRVALVGANSAHYVTIVLAASRLGAVLVPLDPTLTPAELVDLVTLSEAAVTVADASWVPRLGPQVVSMDDLVPVPSPAGTVAEANLELPELSGDDLWAIMYTSGSTSKPQGVMIAQKSFALTGAAMSEALEYTGDDTVGSVLPVHHASVTLMSWAPAVAVGASFALSARFSRSGFWDFIRATGTTVMTTVPTIIEILLTADPTLDERNHRLRMVITHRDIGAFADRYGVEMRALWAMTETGGLGCVQRAGDRPGSVGRPYPDDAEIRLLGVDGNEVADGMSGELWFRHPGVMLGYLGEPPLESGWIASGDLAVRQGDGTLAYVGRTKNMIKRGGENISLEEIERVLFEHPAVDEVVVIPVPDPIYVEEACAVVVWHGGQPQVAELRAYCAETMASWKAPRYVVSWSGELPKLANHKLDRRSVATGLQLEHADDRGSR